MASSGGRRYSTLWWAGVCRRCAGHAMQSAPGAGGAQNGMRGTTCQSKLACRPLPALHPSRPPPSTTPSTLHHTLHPPPRLPIYTTPSSLPHHPQVYSTSWLLTLFAGDLPLETALRLWDVVFLLEGEEGGASELLEAAGCRVQGTGRRLCVACCSAIVAQGTVACHQARLCRRAKCGSLE